MKTIPKLRDFIPEFIESQRRYRKDSVIRSYRQISNKTLIPLFGDMLVSDIGTVEYEALQRKCEDLGHSVKTIIEHRGILMVILRKAWYLKLRTEPEAPAPIPKPEYENKKPLSKEGVRALLAEIDHPDVYDMALMAVRAGLRIGEIRCLTWSDFISVKPVARVKISSCFSGHNNILDKCKGKEKRTLRIWGKVEAAVQLRMNRSKFVFFDSRRPGREDRPMSYEVAHACLVAAAKRAGIWFKDFGFHALRHTYATELAQVNNMTAFKLQALMGHRHISTSMRYISMQSRDIEGDCDPLTAL